MGEYAYMYDVITWEKFYKRSSNYYSQYLRGSVSMGAPALPGPGKAPPGMVLEQRPAHTGGVGRQEASAVTLAS
jgi:hypothetical protein